MNEKDYSILFKELFKPSVTLQKAIDYHHNELGDNYVSLSLRFMGLMGDFRERGNATTLPLHERSVLMNKCLNEIYLLKERYPTCKRFLVTSDSATFLMEARKIDFVYIIPGNIVHTDNTNTDDTDLHLKTLVDFFMISKADKVFLLCTGDMYKSGFSQNAALVNGVPFEIVSF
jgi:hypothetical protein